MLFLVLFYWDILFVWVLWIKKDEIRWDKYVNNLESMVGG